MSVLSSSLLSAPDYTIHKEMKIKKHVLTHTNTLGKDVLQHSLSAVTKVLKYKPRSCCLHVVQHDKVGNYTLEANTAPTHVVLPPSFWAV